MLIGSRRTLLAGRRCAQGLGQDLRAARVGCGLGSGGCRWALVSGYARLDERRYLAGQSEAARDAVGKSEKRKTLPPRKDGSAGSPLRPSQSPSKPASQSKSKPIRKPLATIDGSSGSRQPRDKMLKGGLHKPFKVPEKVGSFNAERVLKGRPVLRDVLNEMVN